MPLSAASSPTHNRDPSCRGKPFRISLSYRAWGGDGLYKVIVESEMTMLLIVVSSSHASRMTVKCGQQCCNESFECAL